MINKTTEEVQNEIMRKIIDVQTNDAQFTQWVTFLKDGNIQEVIDRINRRISLDREYIEKLLSILDKER